MGNNTICVEVVYALPESQSVLTVEVLPGSSVETAVLTSGILTQFPTIDLSQQKVGIFSKLCSLSDPVYEGDRVEIYRSLPNDPKEVRRVRGKKQAASTRTAKGIDQTHSC